MIIRKIIHDSASVDSGELHLACCCLPDLSDFLPLQSVQTRERPDLIFDTYK